MAIPVSLVDYDPLWPQKASYHMSKISPLFYETHHVGSTSVQGLRAKPVVDLLALLDNSVDLNAQQDALLSLGYSPMGEFGVPGRRFFYLNDESGKREINLHVFQRESEEVKRLLAFRDYLRAFPEVAAAYGLEKQRAMSLHADNSTQYAKEKGSFVREATEKAIAWKRSGNPRVEP